MNFNQPSLFSNITTVDKDDDSEFNIILLSDSNFLFYVIDTVKENRKLEYKIAYLHRQHVNSKYICNMIVTIPKLHEQSNHHDYCLNLAGFFKIWNRLKNNCSC